MDLFLFDPLSLFFIFVIFLVSAPSAVYSLGYLKGECSGRKTFLAWILLAAFIISMSAVVAAANAFVFLVSWEIMSLVSYFLVVFDTKHERSVQAGTIYIVMTHIGTAFLAAAFLILRNYSHSFDFAAIKSAAYLIPEGVRNLLFLLLLVGFGTKAGIVPLHVWLPYAHPQAPSHISGIMSGVMIKTAVYGLIRFVIFLLGVQASWWAGLILALALVSCLAGVIYALMEHDLKRLLAYHSVENIGIILLGVGLAMLFSSLQMPYLAVFSLIAGLYHLINHAIFKGLLFLCAGSVYKTCGSRDMEKLGGLIRKMPQTALCFLFGAMAISGLPPLNGFVSEWLTLQAFFLGSLAVAGGLKILLAVSAALLALTGGLAAACFVKAFGITFLAEPRTRFASNACEVGLSMKIAMFFLAALTVAFGLGAGVIVSGLSVVAGSALNIDVSAMRFALDKFTLQVPQAETLRFSPLALALVLLVFAAAGSVFFTAGRKGRTYRTWDCGYYKLDSRNEYTATAFSKPFRIAFGFFLLPYRKTQKIRESFYHVKSLTYETHTTPVFKKYIYEPVIGLTFRAARIMRRMQPGSIHLYLGYIFATVILLLVLMEKF